MPNRTKKGNVTATARKKSAAVKGGKFPIFDKKSAMSALRLRGHGTTPAQRAAIIRKAAKFAPEAAKKAKEADAKRKKK